VFEGAFGERDREAKLAAEPGTLFRLASVSKPVTAAVAMQLVEKGELDLDASVSRFVEGLEPKLGALTLRRLLSHTSGLRHYRADRADNGTVHRTTREALELFAHDPFVAEPGTRYSYSTHAFTLAVAAIEGASKRDFRTLLRENVAAKYAPALDCEVAGEAKSARSALYEKLPAGIVMRSEPRENLSWKYGGGGLECTAADLARFANAVASAKVVSEASRDALWTRTKLADGTSVDYGLGWTVGDKAKLASHSGSQQGASSSLSVAIERGLVIAILSNTQNGGAPELAPKLREHLARAK
jgi:CubicO group peptidase (beta-lactamase class C family)